MSLAPEEFGYGILMEITWGQSSFLSSQQILIEGGVRDVAYHLIPL
jgi:hypothetical protein